MKTKEFVETLEKNTDYVVMGLGSTNKSLQIAYLMYPKGTIHNLRTPILIEFRKDTINTDTGRKIAINRTNYMREFLNEFYLDYTEPITR